MAFIPMRNDWQNNNPGATAGTGLGVGVPQGALSTVTPMSAPAQQMPQPAAGLPTAPQMPFRGPMSSRPTGALSMGGMQQMRQMPFPQWYGNSPQQYGFMRGGPQLPQQPGFLRPSTIRPQQAPMGALTRMGYKPY